MSEREASGTKWQKVLVRGGLLVSTPAGSVPEVIVDGDNGLLVKDDLSDLPEKLEEAVRIVESDDYPEWSRRALQSSPSVLVSRTFDLYISNLYSRN